jgi:hypothetical protein
MDEAKRAPPVNRLGPAKASSPATTRAGDVPETLLARYLVEHDVLARKASFFRDHKEPLPRFVDSGRALRTDNAYADTVRDMLQIARHRAWNRVTVRGETAFRREVWIQGRALGIEVGGHRPTARDRQAAGQEKPVDRTRMRYDRAAVVVRTLIADPEAQARLLARAWAHIASRNPDRSRQDLERTR